MPLFSQDIDWNEFKNPPKSARPMVRWWWPGCDVDKGELIKEVQELDEAGFLGAELQVFMIGSPWKLEKRDKERAARCHRFMQPYYYEMIKAVLDEASKRDMVMDLTIGSAWPAGGVHISKENSMKVLLVGQKVMKGPKYFKGLIPKIKKPFFYKLLKLAKLIIGYNLAEYYKEDMKFEVLVAVKLKKKRVKIKYIRPKTVLIDKSSIMDITDKVDSDGILQWEIPEGKWQVIAFYTGPSGARPLLDCRSTPDEYSLVLDHLSAEAIRNHLDQHIGEGKKYFGNHFGKTLRAFFTDSLELSSEWHWTEGFLDEFNKRRGYDLRPFLPVCFVPNRDNKYAQAFLGRGIPVADFEGDIGERIRYDLELTISDLFSEEFIKEMKNWAEENNLKSRLQAYGMRADTLKTFGFAHIPETEQLYAGGCIDFLKLASSAGILYDKQLVTAESFVWNQRDYMTTPLKMKVAADRLFASGINQIINHGFPYQHPRFPFPGFCGFSTPYLPRMMNFSSNFSKMNPFWKFFPIINKYISRCQYLLQHGKIVSNIAIFYPLFNYCDSVLTTEELIGGQLDVNDSPSGKGQLEVHLKKQKKRNKDDEWTHYLIQLGDQLHSAGYYYTHINEESILKCRIESAKLLIGSGEFEAIIFPRIEKISLNLARMLKEIVDSNIPIIFLEQVPQKQPGFLNYKENDSQIMGLVSEMVQKNPSYYIKNNENLLSVLRDKLNIHPNLVYTKSQQSIYFLHKVTKSSHFYFLRNSMNQPKIVRIKFPHPDMVPIILNPWSGEVSQAVQYKKVEHSIEMDLRFEAYGSVIIEFKSVPEKGHVLEASFKIERINDELFGLLDETTEINIILKDGTIKTASIDSPSLPIINLKGWQLSTEIRDFLGNFKPFQCEMKELVDWRQIPELKYCSGKGTYRTEFIVEKKYLNEDNKLFLKIKRVHDVAIVAINGNLLNPLMVYPFEIDITTHVREGNNKIIIEVIPTLRNRLIGYGKRGGKKWKNHKKKKEFMPSGLIGPIFIYVHRRFSLSSLF